MSGTFWSITQSNNAQSALGKGEQRRAQSMWMECKAGNNFSSRNKKLRTGKIATAIIKIAKL